MSLIGHQKKEKYSSPLMKKLSLIKKTFISIKNITYFQKTPKKLVKRKLEIFAKIISRTI